MHALIAHMRNPTVKIIYSRFRNSCPTCLWWFENCKKVKKSKNLWNTFLISNLLPIFTILTLDTWYIIQSVRTWNNRPYWRKDGRLIRLQLCWVYTQRASKGWRKSLWKSWLCLPSQPSARSSLTAEQWYCWRAPWIAHWEPITTARQDQGMACHLPWPTHINDSSAW